MDHDLPPLRPTRTPSNTVRVQMCRDAHMPWEQAQARQLVRELRFHIYQLERQLQDLRQRHRDEERSSQDRRPCFCEASPSIVSSPPSSFPLPTSSFPSSSTSAIPPSDPVGPTLEDAIFSPLSSDAVQSDPPSPTTSPDGTSIFSPLVMFLVLTPAALIIGVLLLSRWRLGRMRRRLTSL